MRSVPTGCSRFLPSKTGNYADIHPEPYVVCPINGTRLFPKRFRFGETSQRFTDSPLLMLASGATDDYHQWFVPPSFEGGMAFYLTTLPHERHL